MRLASQRGLTARRAVAVFLSGLILATLSAAGKVDLRQQLEWAEKDGDTFARIELIRRLLEQDPRDPALREQLADLWVDVGDYDMAEQTVRDWPDIPADVRARVTAAVLFHRDDKPDDAIAMLAAYRNQAPQNLEITRQLAGYLSALRRDQALVDLLSSASGVENDAGLLVSRSLARRRLLDFEGALADFAAADKKDPDHAAVQDNRVSMDRLNAALKEIRAADSALQKDPADGDALMRRAYWYLMTDFAAEPALADAGKLRRMRPDSQAARWLAVRAAYGAGKISSADARRLEQVDVSKPLPDPKSLARLQAADAAVARSSTAATRRERAAVLRELQQPQLALVEVDEVLAKDPNDTAAGLEKMFCLVQLDRNAEAAAAFQVLSENQPTPIQIAEGLGALAEAAFRASDYETALDYANRALKTKPSAALYRQRGVILQRLYRHDEAEADFAKAENLKKRR